MPTYDVTGTGTDQDLEVADTVTVGLYRHTHNQGGGATADIPDLVKVWTGLAAGVTTFTFGRRNGANNAYVGPVITVTTEIAPPDAPAPDVTGPTVAFSHPVDGDLVEGIVDITFTADDPSGIASQVLTIAGVPATIGAPWDTTGIANNTSVALELTVTDAAAGANVTVETIHVTVFNPPTPTPETPVLATFLDLTVKNRAPYVMWASVPAGLEHIFADPNFVSAWDKATEEESTKLRNGELVERTGSLGRETQTDEQLKAQLIVLWNDFNAEIQSMDDYHLADTSYVGDPDDWVTRA